ARLRSAVLTPPGAGEIVVVEARSVPLHTPATLVLKAQAHRVSSVLAGKTRTSARRDRARPSVRLPPNRGHPLDTRTTALMENGFRHDFSKVRIHSGKEAARATRAIDA